MIRKLIFSAVQRCLESHFVLIVSILISFDAHYFFSIVNILTRFGAFYLLLLLLLETLDFKFVLKPKDGSQCIFEEGPNRSLGCANNELEMRTAVFKLNEKGELDCKIWVGTEMLSPFDLAASWRARQGNLQPSRVQRSKDS
jgi:hypothetical protein